MHLGANPATRGVFLTSLETGAHDDATYPLKCFGTFGDTFDILAQSRPTCSAVCPAGTYCWSGTIVPTECALGAYCPFGSVRDGFSILLPLGCPRSLSAVCCLARC
jgi:hypothetical protein